MQNQSNHEINFDAQLKAALCKLYTIHIPLIPTTPHTAAGIRIEPPPSDPKATGHNPGEINIKYIYVNHNHCVSTKQQGV